jgi:hypothetical protein
MHFPLKNVDLHLKTYAKVLQAMYCVPYVRAK